MSQTLSQPVGGELVEPVGLTDRERELGAIIMAYNEVTERLKESHDQLQRQVERLRDELTDKNRELARRERLAALGEMAAGLAHEIRNPLGGIQLFAGLLARDLADRPAQHRLAEKIGNGVRALEGIVTDILAFAGQAEPRFADVSLPTLLAETIELAAPAFDRAGAVPVFRFGKTGTAPVFSGGDPRRPDTPTCAPQADDLDLEADANQLQQALLNLLHNAAEAAGAGGVVEIGVRVDRDDEVHVQIADTGPGIPPDRLDRIFNPFFTTKDRGTGLGLAIVHRIAEAHGGRIRAANRPGGGAVFTLSIPRRRARGDDRTGEGA